MKRYESVNFAGLERTTMSLQREKRKGGSELPLRAAMS